MGDEPIEVVEVAPLKLSQQQFLNILLDKGLVQLGEKGRIKKLSEEQKEQIKSLWVDYNLISFDDNGNPVHPIENYPICAGINSRGSPCYAYAGRGTDSKGIGGRRCKNHGGASTGATTVEGRLRQVLACVKTGEHSKYLQMIKEDKIYKPMAEKLIEDFAKDPYQATDEVILATLIQALTRMDTQMKSDGSLNVDLSRTYDVIRKLLAEIQTTPRERGVKQEPVESINEITEQIDRIIFERKKVVKNV